MKHINKYIAGAAILLTTASCGNDWLDSIEPSTSIETEGSIASVLEASSAVNGIYHIMQDAYAYSGRMVYRGDACGDDMQAVSSSKRTGNAYRFAFTKDTAPATFWSIPYQMIQNANTIINEAQSINVAASEKADLDNIVGQAKALRALAYFDLCRIYGYPYLKDNGASLGVSIVTTQEGVKSKPKRSTVAECYNFVIKEMEEAVALLSADYNKGKVNKFAAMALLSRIYLYHGDNQKALDMAEQTIAQAEKAGWKLWTTEEYPYAWADDVSALKKGEVLFEIVNTTTNSPGKEALGYLHSYDGYDDICITGSFYNLLYSDKNDVRIKLLSFDGSKYAYVNKYQPQEGEVIQDANIPLVRLSEVYLNAAEAAVKLGNNDKAVLYLDAIVKRANAKNTVQGETVSLDRVLLERRKELVGEGHRFYDIIRNGQKMTRVQETVSKIKSTKHFSDIMEMDWNDYHVVMPIPKAEMNANANMEQNPGYVQ